MPDELADSELCETYGWTWTELQQQPYYVRVMFSHIQAMKEAKRQQNADAPGSGRHRRDDEPADTVPEGFTPPPGYQ